VALCLAESSVFCEKEFGVELEAEVSGMLTPRDDGVLKLKWRRSGRASFSK
jgi:hypothetical protein